MTQTIEEQSLGEKLRQKYGVSNSYELQKKIEERRSYNGFCGSRALRRIMDNHRYTFGDPEYKTKHAYAEGQWATISEAGVLIYPEISDTLNRVLLNNEKYIENKQAFAYPRQVEREQLDYHKELPLILKILDAYQRELGEQIVKRKENGLPLFTLPKSGVYRNIPKKEILKILAVHITGLEYNLSRIPFYEHPRSWKKQHKKEIHEARKLYESIRDETRMFSS